MDEKDVLKAYLAKIGSRGGKKAASKMTKAERTARATKAGKRRQAKARAKKKKDGTA
jgi:hypothetical protein